MKLHLGRKEFFIFVMIMSGFIESFAQEATEGAPTWTPAYFRSLINDSLNIIKSGSTNFHAGDGMELTPATTHKFGAAFFNQSKFSPVNGIQVSFEYTISGGSTFDGKYGDGLSFFLYDRSEASSYGIAAGADGSGLGYANACSINGVPGGYLSIGLDVFGNNSKYYQEECRDGIYNLTFTSTSGQVVIRGARLSSSDYTHGYPTLYAINTNIADNGTSNVVAAELNSSGSYTEVTGLNSSNTFNLRGGTAGYQKAYLTIVPHFTAPSTKDGFMVSVAFKTSNDGAKISVVDSFLYKKSLYYYSKVLSAYETIDASETAFDTLSIGFTGGTGASSERHLVKNVTYSLAYVAEATNDSSTYTLGTTTVIDVLKNDIAYKGLLTYNTKPVVGTGSSYIDYTMSSFAKTSYEQATYDCGIYRTKTDSYGNKWAFNTNDGRVYFTPAKNFKGTATMTYTIKGFSTYDSSNNLLEPYGDASYRSAPATITLTWNGKIAGVMSNGFLQPTFKK